MPVFDAVTVRGRKSEHLEQATVRMQGEDEDIYYYTYDANGNVGQLLDETGVIAAHYEYSPFGKLVKKSGTMANANPYRFSTKYEDETLVYYGFRYYSPELGRWVSRDPIGEDGLNLYSIIYNQIFGGVTNRGLRKKRA